MDRGNATGSVASAGFHSFADERGLETPVDDDVVCQGANGAKTFKNGCCGFAQKRWKGMLLSATVLIVCFVGAYMKLPSYIVQSRLNSASITVDDAGLYIDEQTSSVLNPAVKIFAPKELLQLVPFISFEATMLPFDAVISMDLPQQSGASSRMAQVQLGKFRVSDSIKISSKTDINLVVKGAFMITDVVDLPQAISVMMRQKNVSATMTANTACIGWVWGWLPVYFPTISVSYTATIAGMNNFETKRIMVKDLFTAHGEPSSLRVLGSASVYNPAPMSIQVKDDISMRLCYTYHDVSYIVGRITTNAMTVLPGDNIVTANVSIMPDDTNMEAIQGMITDYIGGMQHGLDPIGTKPFALSVKDDGANTAHSPLLLSALAGLDLTVNFRPKPVRMIRAVTADVVIGGSIIHGHPYECTLHIKIKNPLPGAARVHAVKLDAHHMTLDGPALYKFNRDLDANDYVIQGNEEKWFHFKLYLSEVVFKFTPSEIIKLAEEAIVQNIQLGVDAVFQVTVDPGYQQQIIYKNDGISGAICYHILPPSGICGESISTDLSSEPSLTMSEESEQLVAPDQLQFLA